MECKEWKWREEAEVSLEKELLRRKPALLIGGEIAGYCGW